MNRVLICAAARTPLGDFCGQLEGVSEQRLAAAVMRETVSRAAIPEGEIDEVIVGIAKQTSRPSNGGRHALLLAGLPEALPAYTVQRQNASGLQAVANGCWAIRSGDAGVVLAGGAESTSQIPFEIRDARFAFDGPRRTIVDAIPAQLAGAQPAARYGILDGAQLARELAGRLALTEAELTAFAETSLAKARAARARGDGGEEIVPVAVKRGKTETTVITDELLPAAPLVAPPADGAALCLLASPERADALSLPVLAEILAVGIAAADPRRPEAAVTQAVRRALVLAGLVPGAIDCIELNEGSAAECLAVLRELQTETGERTALAERINVAGGALATGNAWGAMGAVLLVRAVHALRRQNGRHALVALAAEGGQGMALLLGNPG